MSERIKSKSAQLNREKESYGARTVITADELPDVPALEGSLTFLKAITELLTPQEIAEAVAEGTRKLEEALAKAKNK